MSHHSLATLEGCNLLWHIVASPPLFHPYFLQAGVLKNIEKFSMGKFNKGGSCKIQLRQTIKEGVVKYNYLK